MSTIVVNASKGGIGGKRNFEEAVRKSGVAVDLQWKPYLLNPNTPTEGYDLMEYLSSKYGSQAVARFSSSSNPLDQAGRQVGINFNKSRRIVNTVDGHRLMEWCYQHHPEKADQLMEIMFHAYFEQAKDLSKVEELLQCAVLAGLEENESAVRELLSSNTFRSEVLQADEVAKRQSRVSGVPYFIIEPMDGSRPTAFSGAQPADVIAEVLSEAAGV